MDPFFVIMFRVYLCYHAAVFSVPCNFVPICWERADLLALLCVMFSGICHGPIWCSELGMVLVCIDS